MRRLLKIIISFSLASFIFIASSLSAMGAPGGSVVTPALASTPFTQIKIVTIDSLELETPDEM